MFTHETLALGYETLTAQTNEGGRVYETPEGHRYPSMTTVLSKPKTKKSDGIARWRERVGTEKARLVMQFACARGEIVHKLCEDYLNNVEDVEKGWPTYCISTFHQIKPILDERVGTIFGLEMPLYSNLLKVAGRVDLVAEFDGKPSIIDFKTSKVQKRESWVKKYFLQETGYALMVQERTGLAIEQIVTIIACDDGETQLFVKDRAEYEKELFEKVAFFYED
jgi:genome maintenance exonuclease 1